MPEGDTLYRTASVLGRAINGETILAARTLVPGLEVKPLLQQTITAVEARGKNLLIQLENGYAIRSHLRMTGSWHIYRPGEAWRKPEQRARLVLETEPWIAVCFNAPVVEVLSPAALHRHRVLVRLGPDPLKENWDEEEAIRRLRTLPAAMTLGEAIMVQEAVAGIGNVYKSEVLFLRGLNPFQRLTQLTDDELRMLLEEARRLMRLNLQGGQRTTRHTLDRQPLWVYGRSGGECFKCGRQIEMRRQGEAARSTYYCPRCQQV